MTTPKKDTVKSLLAPNLRFRQFKGDWKPYQIEELVPKDVKYGIVDGPFGSNLKTIHYRTSGIPIITSGYVTDGVFNAEDYLFVDEEKFEKEKRSAVRPGDIVMAKIGARCGASAILPKTHQTGILSGNALKITVDESRFVTNIVWQQLWNLYLTGQIDGLKTVGAQPAISLASLKKFQLTLPSLPEQQKIAAFLSAVDEKIQQLTRKKELLEQYKKGVMQQLFSGKLRFKDTNGKPYPKWEEKRLREVLEIGSGRDYKHLREGDIPVFGTGGLMTLVNDFLYDGETVCIGRKGTIDKPMYYKGKIWTVDTLFYTHSFKNAIPKFVFYVFQLINWRLHNEASGVPSLSKTTIEKLRFKFPSVEEQQKIASFLTALDAKIESVNQQIAQTQTFKKGLLQQMFV